MCTKLFFTNAWCAKRLCRSGKGVYAFYGNVASRAPQVAQGEVNARGVGFDECFDDMNAYWPFKEWLISQ